MKAVVKSERITYNPKYCVEISICSKCKIMNFHFFAYMLKGNPKAFVLSKRSFKKNKAIQ